MNTPAQNPSVQVIPFIAESAADAVAQIRAKLGSDAVVVNVRQLPADGLSKLWKSPRIEVLAYKPDAKASEAAPDPLGELKQELQAIRQQLTAANVSAVTDATGRRAGASAGQRASGAARSAGLPSWRVGEVLETSGLMSLYAQQVMEWVQSAHGEVPPASLAEELVLARQALMALWPARSEKGEESRGEREQGGKGEREKGSGGDFAPAPFHPCSFSPPHILVGPAGAGKTTCICKWLAQARLVEGRMARVWRLDAATANTAEALSVYCEILGVPTERIWTADGERVPSSEFGVSGSEVERGTQNPKPGTPNPAAFDSELRFVDLPGVDWRNATAIHDLKRTVEGFGACHVHLVLNAAYEVPLLLAQVRAFSSLPIDDLIFTHLDEEARWGKVWNVVLGTNYPVRFLSAAQNVPGEFLPATAERILARQFPA